RVSRPREHHGDQGAVPGLGPARPSRPTPWRERGYRLPWMARGLAPSGVPRLEHRGVPAQDHGPHPHSSGRGRRVRHLEAGRGDRKAGRRLGGSGRSRQLRTFATPRTAGDGPSGDGGVYRAACAMKFTSSAVRAYYRRVLPFYDLELADRGDEKLWTWAASVPTGCRVLELGAGSGRATAFLARSAGFVVALDLSPEMIAVARRRLAGAANVVLAVADMRETELRTRFDLVAAVDDPFVHLVEDEDRQRAFATVARHLTPGGRFILDAAWFPPDQRWAAGGEDGLVQE